MTNILLATAAPATGTKTPPRSGGQSSAGFEAAMTKVLASSSTPPGARSEITFAASTADSTRTGPVSAGSIPGGPVVSAPVESEQGVSALAVTASADATETGLLSSQPIPAGRPLVGHAVPMDQASIEQETAASADDGPVEATPVPAGPSVAETVPVAPAPSSAPPVLILEPNLSAERLTGENAAGSENASGAVKDSATGHATADPVLPAAPAAPNQVSSAGPATVTAVPAQTTNPTSPTGPASPTSPANGSAPVTPSRSRTESPILGQGVARAERAPASPTAAAAQPVSRTAPTPSMPAAGTEFDAATRISTAMPTVERDLQTTTQPANPSQAAPSMPTPPTSAPAAAPATAIAAPAAPPAAAPSVPFTAQIAGPVFSLSSAAAGEHVLTINVAPDNLGPVTVRAHVSGDGIRVELFAPNDAGRDALRAIMPELRRDLSGSGMNLELASGDQPTDDDGPVRERAGQDQRGRDERERPRDSGHGQGSQRADDQAGRGTRDTASTLDVLV